jgi:hypothetical protein
MDRSGHRTIKPPDQAKSRLNGLENLALSSDEKECLVIPDIFGFDDDWDDWLSTYRDLSDDKPISLF